MKQNITLLLVCAMASLALTANAQTTAWTENIGAQLATSLESDNTEVRAKAVQQVVYFASYHPEIDLTATVPALLRVYRKDNDDRYRIMAAVGLHAIGDEDGMQKVRDILTRQRNRTVQIVSLAAVTDYFGAETFEGQKEVGKIARSLLDTM